MLVTRALTSTTSRRDLVYHIPNALVTVLSNHTNLLVLEPLSVARKVAAYSLTNRSGDQAEALEAATRDAHFTEIGASEDRARRQRD